LVEDEQWVLDPPDSKYLKGHSDISTETLEKQTEEKLAKMIEEEFVAIDDIQMEGPEVVSAPISSFLTELKQSGDVKHHPVAWALALLVVAPGAILGIGDITSGQSLAKEIGLSGVLATGIIMLFDFLVIGQLVLGPGACSAFARRKLMGAAVFVAMGSSAVLLISHEIVEKIARDYDVIAPIICFFCIAPLILVLRNKRRQIRPGKSRQVWATLMSISILMFSSATIVPALINMSETDVAPELAWSSLLIIAGIIAWAWPRGRHFVEEIAEDIIQKGT
jgi:hypothetical protein